MEIGINLDNSKDKKKAIGLIHKVYLSFIKNNRIYRASTKTKSEVRGGGKKPWRQKGTGQARAGSIRSPLWKGGGVIFGPKPKEISKKINKKERKLAILAALYLKKNKIKVLKNNLFSDSINSKTKSFILFLKNLNITPEQKVLIILPELTRVFKLASNNLKNIEIVSVTSLNINQLLNSKTIIISEESLTLINKIYGKA
jgi:large subunit ribosomal protein L4